MIVRAKQLAVDEIVRPGRHVPGVAQIGLADQLLLAVEQRARRCRLRLSSRALPSNIRLKSHSTHDVQRRAARLNTAPAHELSCRGSHRSSRLGLTSADTLGRCGPVRSDIIDRPRPEAKPSPVSTDGHKGWCHGPSFQTPGCARSAQAGPSATWFSSCARRSGKTVPRRDPCARLLEPGRLTGLDDRRAERVDAAQTTRGSSTAASCRRISWSTGAPAAHRRLLKVCVGLIGSISPGAIHRAEVALR